MTTPLLRPAEPEDVPGIIALIDAVYREHGDRIHLEGADADLTDVPESYGGQGGAFVVLQDERLEGTVGGICGSHAVLPLDSRRCTFRRLYLDARLRGTPWSDRLMEWALDWAASRGFVRVEFWSDTRFERAHRFFARWGFQRGDAVRDMQDGWLPYREYFYSRPIEAPASSRTARAPENEDPGCG